MMYQTEKMLRENGENIPADEKTRIEAALADLKAVKDGGDIEAIKRAVEQLDTASQTRRPEALRECRCGAKCRRWFGRRWSGHGRHRSPPR